MNRRQIEATPSSVIVEQLVASGVEYVFNNPGSREARFLDALHSHKAIKGITALHEGAVAAMAGGYAQSGAGPAVMTVHLGAGVAQSLGQFINLAQAGLPVVLISFAGDTGSYYDTIAMDVGHDFGPTSISTPFTKASWTVVEPGALPLAIDRAMRVATTPPVGPVHVAVYDRVLGPETIETDILEGGSYDVRAGYPDDGDVEEIDRALRDAERPLLFFGDGVEKVGAQAALMSLAERLGLPVAGDVRGFPIKHPLHCGDIRTAVDALRPDTIVCIGVRHSGAGFPEGHSPTSMAGHVIAIGPGDESYKNIQDVDKVVLADELRTLERLEVLSAAPTDGARWEQRRGWALEQAASLRAARRKAALAVETEGPHVRGSFLGDTLDAALERRGGARILMEQFCVPINTIGGQGGPGRNEYMYAAGGSEGYAIGGTIGLKIGAPEKRVVGLVGDGSMLYSDSGIWTAAHHRVPVLYVIPNNQAYGVVAGAFAATGGQMKQTGEYAGLALQGIDPAKLAEGFGVQSMTVADESTVADAIETGLDVVDNDVRPFLLDVRLPLGLPDGGRPIPPFHLVDGD